MTAGRKNREVHREKGTREEPMNRTKFQRICAAVAAGESKFVENTRNRHAGKLLACTGEIAEIDIYGKREIWSRAECREFFLPNLDYRE